MREQYRGTCRRFRPAWCGWRAVLSVALAVGSAGVGAADISGYIETREAAQAAETMAAAAASFLERAKAGDAEAQFRLGQALRKGQGVAMDSVAAATWLREAADQGHAEAQYALAEMYERGEGVPQSDARALHWYGKAAEQGQAAAQVGLATLIVNSGNGKLADAYMWFERAAAAGHANGVRGALALEPLISPDELADARQRAREGVPAGGAAHR